MEKNRRIRPYQETDNITFSQQQGAPQVLLQQQAHDKPILALLALSDTHTSATLPLPNVSSCPDARLCDINPGRMAFAKSTIGVPDCPSFVNFDEMLAVAKPDLVMVASYFRRWHGLHEKGGTLLLHKAAHHFDLLNWWIGSDPVEVHAFGGLDFYGHNNAFRGPRCSGCEFKDQCAYYWDISQDPMAMSLYRNNEQHDGYIRDGCVWRSDIDIFDKMAVQIRYANDVQVAYSLTTYSPYEGFRLAFNGKQGRLETWEGVPSLLETQEDQSKIYAKEMSDSSHSTTELAWHEIVTQPNFGDFTRIRHPFIRKAHWGGDPIMMDEILRGKIANPGLHQAANYRDGAMSVLIGIAARHSIDEGRAIRIDELTDLVPQKDKWAL